MWIVIPVVSAVVLFGVQFLLCYFLHGTVIEFMPWVYVFIILIFAVRIFFGDSSRGFIETNHSAVAMLLAYAGICAVSLGAAMGLCRLLRKR